MNASLPDWMKTEEAYQPTHDADGFITQTSLQLMGVLARARHKGSADVHRGASASFKLLLTFYLLVLLALAQNSFFALVVLAGLLIRCCFLPGKTLKTVMGAALGGAFLSILLLLPSVFLGSPKSMLTISFKVFLSVGLVNLLSVTTPWNRLTESLRFFHVPDLLIFTFDITLKYIVLLGEVCLHMLDALRLRSVGTNKHKGKAFSGIMGTAFLKSRAMAEEMYGAMVCRGFEGEYASLQKPKLTAFDLLPLTVMIAMTVLFFYLEGKIR